MAVFHNPDRYMADLRQIITQGRKRIGLLIGAGAPGGVKVDPKTGEIDPKGDPLIPVVVPLTADVLNALKSDYEAVLEAIQYELEGPNIEDVLTKVRGFGNVLGVNKVHGLDAEGYSKLADAICEKIGEIVSKDLPPSANPFSYLVGWIGGVDRENPVEIFTTNYDLLMEQALERAKVPYFDGFVGAHEPFFDPSTVAKNDLPNRWVRLWKLHGSLGWKQSENGKIVRTGDSNSSELIYPEHMKYARTEKGPYAALFERLRAFLSTPDTILITNGFSFADLHIASWIEESLSGNPSTSVIAFQFGDLDKETHAASIASRRPNMTVFARDGAVINCVAASWKPGELQNKDWLAIRLSYWKAGGTTEKAEFVLGDFTAFAEFFALSTTEQDIKEAEAGPNHEETVEGTAE